MDESNTDVGCYSTQDPRTVREKLRDRLFPSQRCPTPDVTSEFQDCIRGIAVTKLSWCDRIRVLLTGVVITRWRTATENMVGQTINEAVCYIGTPKDLKH